MHAVPVPRVNDRGPHRGYTVLDSWSYATAVCGAVVKVMLSIEFDPGDEDSCPKCVGPALRGEHAPRRQYVEPPAEPLDDEYLDELEAERAREG